MVLVRPRAWSHNKIPLSVLTGLLLVDGKQFSFQVVVALLALVVIVFSRRHQHYIPFVDEGAYKVWSPLALALDAAATDLLYLTLVPSCFVLFRPRVAHQWNQMRVTGRMVRR